MYTTNPVVWMEIDIAGKVCECALFVNTVTQFNPCVNILAATNFQAQKQKNNGFEF